MGPREEAALKADALACLDAAVRAVEPERLTESFLRERPELLASSGRLAIVAVGKAAAAMARGAARVVSRQGASTAAILLAPEGEVEGLAEALTSKGLFTDDAIEVYGGGHPIPKPEGVRGARAIHRLAGSLAPEDTLLCLISGGGSALMTLPPEGISLEDVQATTQALLRGGATIRELNAVRKHLDLLKGGRLAALAAPARVIGLVLSDVVGDPLDVIASGPVSPDPSTYRHAHKILEQYEVSDLPDPVRTHLMRGRNGEEPESPGPGDSCFERVETHIIGSNRLAAAAALREAESRGYASRLLTTRLAGEAREVGRVLASIGQEIAETGQPLKAPACLVAAGETTVTVQGKGRGGRNQEVALGAALALGEGDRDARVLVVSMGTDGIDGPTDAAGAWATASTVHRGAKRGIDARRILADNDAYRFFKAEGGLIVTGATGTNVMDVAVVLVGGKV